MPCGSRAHTSATASLRSAGWANSPRYPATPGTVLTEIIIVGRDGRDTRAGATRGEVAAARQAPSRRRIRQLPASRAA